MSTNPAKFRRPGNTVGALICAFISFFSVNTNAQGVGSRAGSKTPGATVPKGLMLQIVRAEDERRWDTDLQRLLADASAPVRMRAALAAGRIGDERAVEPLISLLQTDKDSEVRSMTAFALGEMESATAAAALMAQLVDREPPQMRGRVVEALGKIAAALPTTDEARKRDLGKAIIEVLDFEAQRRSAPDTVVILSGLTATLRARPENAGKVIAQFLSYSDPRVRADAANALARLRAKDGNEQLRKLVSSDPEPVVRANAARVLGATEDKAALDSLLQRALKDTDSRVRVSAIRALAALKDDRGAPPLLARGEQLLDAVQKGARFETDSNEILELATSIGRLLPNSKNAQAVRWLRQLRSKLGLVSPEVEVAFARVSPQLYQIAGRVSINPPFMSDPNAEPDDVSVFVGTNWVRWSSVGQGLAELALVKSGNPILDASIKEESERILSHFLACPPYSVSDRKFKPKAGAIVGARCVPMPPHAFPDFLRALAAFKPKDLSEVLRKHLKEPDVIIRATAAELMGELPLNSTNTEALSDALKVALRDKELNDAALAILDALTKLKNGDANLAIKLALDSSDHLIRRKAVASLKANGVGDFSARIGSVQTRNMTADYERALSRLGKSVSATLSTTKGSFTIELLTDDALLTVDNFIQLAKRSYFNGISFHRVVSNFVIQGGDPRGDGNGGPGYSIRCEINQAPYDRGAVGMALSGKDTGGSQWFVTHSPQPHLDGGYTVFGRVIVGMEVVDRITRGDVIRSIVISEKRLRALRPRT